MRDSVFIPVVTVGVIAVVFLAALAVAYLSGSAEPPVNGPSLPQMAPIQTLPDQATGSILCSEPGGTDCVIVTGYDATQDTFSYQPVSVEAGGERIHIQDQTLSLVRDEFENRYPFALTF